MRFLKQITILLALLLLIVSELYSQTNPDHVYVNGYYRKNGTYVRPHYRTAPNNTNRDNFSTLGNVNPYTGKPGYIIPDNSSPYSLITSSNKINYNTIQSLSNLNPQKIFNPENYTYSDPCSKVLVNLATKGRTKCDNGDQSKKKNIQTPEKLNKKGTTCNSPKDTIIWLIRPEESLNKSIKSININENQKIYSESAPAIHITDTVDQNNKSTNPLTYMLITVTLVFLVIKSFK
jgi:hypothetical protein